MMKGIDEYNIDISTYKISSHAIERYIDKCNPKANSIKAIELMRKNLTTVKEECIKNTRHDDSRIYLGKDDIEYVTVGKTIKTVYPKNRILYAKVRTNKRGWGFL